MSILIKAYETRSMPSLVEQRNNLIQEAEALVEKAKTETRSLDDQEITRFDEIKTEVTKIDKTIQAEQEAEGMATESAKTPEQEEQRALDEEKLLEIHQR